MNAHSTLREILAKASPLRSGDVLAGVAAANDEERVRAQMVLADVPLKRFLNEEVVPYEQDEITRLILDSHDAAAFAPISSFTVGQFRDWLLTDAANAESLAALTAGITPEMAAAASKLMRLQDLILVASKCSVVTRFRNTIGLPGHFSVRLQPNHPTDDARGILASTIDGLYYGSGDAVIGINPASDSLENIARLLCLLDELIARYEIPTQSCVLTHVTNAVELIRRGVPLDLCFQSIAGTEKANASFGIDLSLLEEAWQATLELGRGTVGDDVMYFETGQRPFCQRQFRGRSANPGMPRLRRGPQVPSIAGEYRGWIYRAGVSVQWQADYPRRAGRPLLRQTAGSAYGGGHLLHQPCRCRSGRHGCTADLAGRGWLQFYHGYSWCGRHHAQLSIHLVPRCGLSAQAAGQAACTGV